MGNVIGIDLGTTNTVVACDGEISSIDPQTGNLLPSVVAFPPSGETWVGAKARGRRWNDPKNTIFSAKRIIGQRWHSSAAKEFRRRYQFDLEEDAEGLPAFVTRAGNITATGIASRILERIGIGTDIDLSTTTGVITVPSLFREPQLEATREAGLAAGLKDVQIMREPAATATVYLGTASTGSTDIRRAAVYDLGGGTFDMAVISCAEKPFKILGHGGDIFLGGDDIDLGLAKWAADEVLKLGWDIKTDQAVFARLVTACEQAKIALSDVEEVSLNILEVDAAAPAHAHSLVLTRQKLNELASHLVRRTFIICDEVLMQVGMRAKELDAIFLAGGATYLEVVRQGIEAYFQKEVEFGINPMEVVALGASMKGV